MVSPVSLLLSGSSGLILNIIPGRPLSSLVSPSLPPIVPRAAAGEMFVDISDRVSAPVSSLLSTVPLGPALTLVLLQMFLQPPLVPERLVLPAEPTEMLDLGGVAGAVPQPHVVLHLSLSAAQTVPAALEAGDGRQPLQPRGDNQSLRLAGAQSVLLLHVSHGKGLQGENLRAVPALEGLLHVVLRDVRLQSSLLQ